MEKQLRIKGKSINLGVTSSTISKNQEDVIAETTKLLLSWLDSKKFVSSETVDQINEVVSGLVDAGVIHAIDQGRLFHGIKTVYDVVRKNQYTVEEYNQRFTNQD